jgi:hypothetical protein
MKRVLVKPSGISHLEIGTPIGYPPQLGTITEDIDRAEVLYGAMFGLSS